MHTLAQYREIARDGGWAPIPGSAKEKIEPGTQNPRIIAVRARLAITGDLQENRSHATSDLYDGPLEAAVQRFQKRHGLIDDGVIGVGTIQAMNVPVEERIRQLSVGLERLRWLPRDFGERHIVVNIPSFDLTLMDKGKPAITMRTVVGRQRDRTPALSATMQYLVLNPRWNVPKSITNKELIPKVRNNPEYLASRRYKVYQRNEEGAMQQVDPTTVDWDTADASSIRLQQDSGAGNSLGRIKFMFPNRFSVYLHDTPSRSLFSRQTRAFSHGCVRVEHPRDLATEVLKYMEGWDGEKIRQAVNSGRHRTVHLDKPLPVHIIYQTAWSSANGTPQFRSDIYRYDHKVAKALKI